MNPVLTFQNGKFILTGGQKTTNFLLISPSDSYWSKPPAKAFSDFYETTNLKAAAEFRRFSDEIAEKVFNRAFNRSYGAPSLPLFLNKYLDPHQIEGVRHILSRRRSYIAHAPGAGKTGTAITASFLVKAALPTLFIVPPSLTLNWARELEKFSAFLKEWPIWSIIPNTDKVDTVDWSADYIICPDSMLTKAWVYKTLANIDFKMIGVDEASRFKEPTSLRSLVFYGGRINKSLTFPGLYQKAKHVVFLDGSPMPNRPMELWGPTYALDPEAIDCMSQHEFGLRFCGATVNDRGQWEYRHSSRETELKKRMRDRFMHVVEEERLSHPERRRSMLFMNKDIRTAEQKAWERKNLDDLNFVPVDDENSSQGEIASYRRELGKAKVPWISNYVLDRLTNTNEKILLFAWHREVCEDLSVRLSRFSPGLVIGGTSNENREKFFREFQDGGRRLIIGNISAMGRGHNLQKADRVIFGEYSWTDELNKQCEKRASRRGRDSESFVRCEYIVAPDSMDERVLQAVFTKAKRVKAVIG